MLALRRIVTVLVMIYLLLALLFIVTGGARDAMMSVFNSSREYFWYTMFLIGAGLLLLQLLTENAHGVTLRRDITRHEAKVNELKAKLYDQQLEQRDRDIRATTATTVPRPEPAPNTIPRGAMTPPPPAYPADERPIDPPHPSDRPLM